MKTTDVGSHVSATCILCGRPVADQAYACATESAKAARDLAALAETTPEARAVAYGQTRGAHGASSSKPGSRSPGNDDALDMLAAVGNSLGTWVRVITEERGVYPERVPPGFDTIAPAARFLGEHLEWLRHREFVDEAFSDFAQAASKLRFLIDGPAARKYLGPCGATLRPRPCCDLHNEHCEPHSELCCHECTEAAHPWHLDGRHCVLNTETCEGDVYGPAGGKSGRCRTCGAEVDQGERRAWLDGLVADRMADTPMRASDIAHAIRVNVNNIRTWADRDKLSSFWWDGQRYVPWVDPPEGVKRVRLHYVADVMELDRQRAERKADRERRNTQATAA